VSDLGALIPSTVGKIELESLSDEVPEERIVDRLIARSIHEVFGRRVEMDTLTEVIEAFDSGLVIRTGEAVPSRDYVRWMRETPGMSAAVGRLGVGESPAAVASAVEFLLEGLHLHRRLNKDRAATGGLYRA
jgi:magnesium chelatase subunit I